MLRDKQLVRRILRGDVQAGEKLVDENYPRLYRFLLYLSREPETASELVQRTFDRAWHGLPEYRGEASLSTWLHRIAWREFLRYQRESCRDLPLDSLPFLPENRSAPLMEGLVLEGALAQLSDPLRITFLMVAVQQLSIKETALALEAPEGTIKSRLSAAREQLRTLLAENPPVTPPRTKGPFLRMESRKNV